MNLIESVKIQQETRLEWLDQIRLAGKKLSQLPKEIQELEGVADCYRSGILKVDLFGGDAVVEICKKAGVVFGTPLFQDYNGTFNVDGNLDDFKITIHGMTIPPQCHTEKGTYKVTKFKLVCNKTGKEIK